MHHNKDIYLAPVKLQNSYTLLKKSLYDIAMEKKNNQTTQNENIIIVRKKPIFQTIFEIIGKILKVIIYMILIILLTVGATVLINSQTREFLVEILKNVF